MWLLYIVTVCLLLLWCSCAWRLRVVIIPPPKLLRVMLLLLLLGARCQLLPLLLLLLQLVKPAVSRCGQARMSVR
jgi:hypothetical protein